MTKPGVLLLLLALAAVACEEKPELSVDPAWLGSRAWDDGAAVVSVYRGRYNRYGKWREAEVRDYLVREYLDGTELTKRDRQTDGLIPVLKANRQLTFSTGTYDYRMMHSLFLDRRDGRLVKATASCQEGCGLVFLRWDQSTRALSYDSYWEGEGVGSTALSKQGRTFFFDELPFLGASLEDGVSVSVLPSLLRNRVGSLEATPGRVRRDGRRCRLEAEDGSVAAEFEYDAEGFLLRWEVPGREEFRRTGKRRFYYWEKTDPGDEKLLEGK